MADLLETGVREDLPGTHVRFAPGDLLAAKSSMSTSLPVIDGSSIVVSRPVSSVMRRR
ncbi:MAG: hypothetical protein H0V48_03720 [Nocardioidaceae bacterium]|nr:hypothetical protein [Nocardioidaceae bacterium]